MRGVRSAFFHSSTIWRITCYGSFVPANGWSCSGCGSNHLRGYTSEPKLRTSPNWWSAPHPPSFQHLVPGRNGVVSKHSPPGLGHWRRGGTQLKARSSPTARGRGHRRLEVNEPFLLLAEQPPFTVWLLWRGIGTAVLIRHGLESLLIPPNGFVNPPIRGEQFPKTPCGFCRGVHLAST